MKLIQEKESVELFRMQEKILEQINETHINAFVWDCCKPYPQWKITKLQ